MARGESITAFKPLASLTGLGESSPLNQTLGCTMKNSINLICNLLAILCVPLGLAYYAFMVITFAGLISMISNNLRISWLLVLLIIQIILGSYGWASLYKLYRSRNKNLGGVSGCIKAGVVCGVLSIFWNPVMLVCATPAITLSAILLFLRANQENA